MQRHSTDLWILGGFLGSGKTSLLNRLLSAMEERRVGVVVNDFGKLGVDARQLRQSGEESIVELNGGQIFCSCLCGNFVEAVISLARRGPEALLVESSGLAKPSAMKDILEEILRRAEGSIVYRGFVTVVDLERMPKLIRAVAAIEEQIAFADLLAVNKIDLVSGAQLEEIRAQLRRINGAAALVETSYGALSPEQLPAAPLPHEGIPEEAYAGWGAAGRPKAVTWKPDRQLTDAQLAELLRLVADSVFRVKGYLRTAEGLRRVSLSGRQLALEELEEPEESRSGEERIEEGLTVILPPRRPALKIFGDALRQAAGERA